MKRLLDLVYITVAQILRIMGQDIDSPAWNIKFFPAFLTLIGFFIFSCT